MVAQANKTGTIKNTTNEKENKNSSADEIPERDAIIMFIRQHMMVNNRM